MIDETTEFSRRKFVAGRRRRRRRADPRRRSGRRRRGRAAASRSRAAGSSRRASPPASRARAAMTLWTRLEGYSADRLLTVEVARDDDFRRVVFRRNVIARASEDGTVKLRVQRGLKPGERYFYRFETKSDSSRVGTFHTLRPADSNEPVRIAFFSCQDYQSGFYGAHDAIAREDVDLVVCLGDYIYEKNFYEGPRKDTLGANGDGEVLTLPEYRVEVPPLQGRQGPPGDARRASVHRHLGRPRGRGQLRRRPARRRGRRSPRRRLQAPQLDGYRAYFEYMPFRRPRRARTRRNYRRSRSAGTPSCSCSTSASTATTSPAATSSSSRARRPRSRGATLLGPGQLEWLKSGLETSRANWKLIGNQLMIMSLDIAAGRADQQGPVGRLRRRAARDPAARRGQGHQGRLVHHRRHPHVLRRRRRRRRPRAGERGDGVRRRVGHVARHPGDRPGHERRAARPPTRRSCCPAACARQPAHPVRRAEEPRLWRADGDAGASCGSSSRRSTRCSARPRRGRSGRSACRAASRACRCV